MMYGISMHSVVPLRKDPLEQSEMVSQLLFGECYRVSDEKEQWLQILTVYDDYTGWIDRKLHYPVSENFYQETLQAKSPVLGALLMNIERRGEPPRLILAGSTLPGYNEKKDLLLIDQEVFHVLWTFDEFGVRGLQTIPKTARKFLNTPYLWGGRSFLGFDCSGFVQTVYKIHGISLKRDSYQQAEQGARINSLEDARAGDLAFFADEDGRVYHVGMVIAPDEIIHSSGYVHIDRLDETGIFNLRTRSYSHRLHSIRRVSG